MRHFEDFYNEAQQYTEILRRFEENGEIFTDPNFIPTSGAKDAVVGFDEEKHTWKRIIDIYKAPLFKKDIIKEDAIQQSELGTCFFTTALSRVAKQPELVEQLFDTRTLNQETLNLQCGAVIIYFHAFGKRTPVLIDTLIPFQRETQLPKFSRPSDITYSPWFCLVEKAYAKLHGSYSAIISGKLSQAIYHLFGYYPCYKNIDEILQKRKNKLENQNSNENISNSDSTNIQLSDNDYLFSLLMKWQYQNAVLGADIMINQLRNGVTKKDIEELGLLSSHAYLIEKVRSEEGKNFICLKSPLKDHVWLGDWSNSSSLWTPKLKRELGVHKRNNGTFWMIADDFFRYFSSFDIAKPVDPEYHNKSIMSKLLPYEYDGYDILSKEAELSKHQTFVFKLNNVQIKTNESQETDNSFPVVDNLKVYITIEKRRPFIEGDQDAHYQIFTFYSGGQKISEETPEVCKGIQTNSCFYRSAINVRKNTPFVIVFQRNDRRDYTEECYVRFSCKYDFDLFDYDKPEQLSSEDEKIGVLFDNESKRYGNISRKIINKEILGQELRGYENIDISESNATFYKDLKLNPSNETVSGFYEYSVSDDECANKVEDFVINMIDGNNQPENAGNKAESEHASTKQESEHISNKAESEHLSHKQESEHLSNKAESEHVSAKQESEHLSNKAESEHLSHKQESEHVSNKQESEHVSNKQESEHVSNKQESEHVSAKHESEHVSNKQESEHLSNRAGSEHFSNKQESEHASTKHESEHLSNKAESEHLSNRVGSEHLSNKQESEHLSNKQESEHLSNRVGSEHLSNKQESEHASTKHESENLSNKAESEHISNRAGSEHISNKQESEHISNKQESEHLSNRAGSEHASTKHESEHISNKQESEHFSNKAESEHLSNRAGSEHISNKQESEHLSNKAESEHASTKHESEHASSKHESEHASSKHESEHASSKHESEHASSKHESEHASSKHESALHESHHSSSKHDTNAKSSLYTESHPSESSSTSESTESTFFLGLKYYSGRGVPVDKQKALELFTNAADNGHGRSQFNAGFMYANGDGVPKDPQKAFKYYEMASKKRVPKAMFCLGVLYLKGQDGVPKNKEKAAQLFELASDKEEKALYNLALMYQNGYGVQKDVKRAINLFERAAQLQDADALYNLGQIYENGFDEIQANKPKAVDCYTQASDLGNDKAQLNLGLMYLRGQGCIFDIEKARQLITKSSDQGNMKAKELLHQGLPILSTPKVVNSDDDDYNDNEDEDDNEAYSTKNDDYYSSSHQTTKDKEEVLFDVFQLLEKRIKRIHRKLTDNFVSPVDALNDIDSYLIDRNLSTCVSEFTTVRDFLVKAEDKAFLEIAKEKQRKNRLPRLVRNERGQISLNDPDGFLSLSEINFNSPTPVDDDYDDELYRLGMDVRTLEMKLNSVDQQIQNSKKPFLGANDFLSASSSSESPRNKSNGGSFDNYFNNLVDESGSSASSSRRNYPTPPRAPPASKSPYQTRIKRFSNK